MIFQNLLQLENAWQSLAYSPLGAVVSPPTEYLWKTLTYWSPECLTAPSHCEHRWTKLGNNYRLRPYIFLPKTQGWLIRILPNFHEMYRNDCQLTCWNQNVIFQSVSERQYAKRTKIVQFWPSRSTTFIFSPTLTQKLLNLFSQFFTRCRAISRAINACSCKTIVHFVSEHESKERRRQFWRLQKSLRENKSGTKQNWLPWQRPLRYWKNFRSIIYTQNPFIRYKNCKNRIWFVICLRHKIGCHGNVTWGIGKTGPD